MTTATIPTALEQYLRSLTGRELFTLRADSRGALTAAWPHRHAAFNARVICRANAQMLRTIRYLFGSEKATDDA